MAGSWQQFRHPRLQPPFHRTVSLVLHILDILVVSEPLLVSTVYIYPSGFQSGFDPGQRFA